MMKKCKCGDLMASMINVNGWKCKKCNIYYLWDPLTDQWVWLQPWQLASQVETIPGPASAARPANLVELPDVSTVVDWVRERVKARPEVIRMDVRTDPAKNDHLDVIARTDYPDKVLLIISDFCVALRKGEIK